LLNGLSRSSSAFADEDNTTLLTLSKIHFLKLMGTEYQVELKERVSILKKFAFLSSIDNIGLLRIAEKIFPRTYPKDSIIIREEEASNSVYFIKSGKCAVFRKIIFRNIPINVLLGYISQHESFNEISAVNFTEKTGSPFTVVATDNVEIISISSQWLQLDLTFTPSQFAALTNEELVNQYEIELSHRKFRAYQSKYISEIIKQRKSYSFKLPSNKSATLRAASMPLSIAAKIIFTLPSIVPGCPVVMCSPARYSLLES
jgi:CRP-like cAMP-binding protein